MYLLKYDDCWKVVFLFDIENSISLQYIKSLVKNFLGEDKKVFQAKKVTQLQPLGAKYRDKIRLH